MKPQIIGFEKSKANQIELKPPFARSNLDRFLQKTL
jgi:hypothetical protein